MAVTESVCRKKAHSGISTVIWSTRMGPSRAFRKARERCSRPAVRRIFLILALTLASTTVRSDQQVTLRGEIADTYCLSARGIRGPSHTACALRCARKGIPLALVEEGTRHIYILLPPKDESSMPEAVIRAAGT